MRATNLILMLTHFWPVLPFYNPSNQQQTFGFLVFSGVQNGNIERKTFWTIYNHAQKMKFSIKYFFSKFDQIRRKLQIWSFTDEIFNEKLHFLQCQCVGRLSKSIIEAITKEFRQKLNWINGKMYKRWHRLVQ